MRFWRGCCCLALSKAKTSAQRVLCMNNMQQVQLALNMFVLDSDGYLPSHARPSFATDPEKWKGAIASWRFMDIVWHHELWDGYLDQNTNVFHCAGNLKIAKAWKVGREFFPDGMGRRRTGCSWMGMRSPCGRSRLWGRLGKWRAAGIEPTSLSKSSIKGRFQPDFPDEGYSP